MAFQVLYLKWRPQRFEDVIGQEHITQTLKNALRAGRIAHAYLFAGPRGTGKTTMARLLAKAVNCLDEDVSNRPCNVCHICRSINESRLLDLIEMDAASHTGVDNVREAIRDKVGFRPTEARYKVYVIDEVHMLSTSAFNALLKTLEEPPEHVIFVLATTEPHKILPTILSRCQRFDFRRIARGALVGRLQYIADQEGIQVDENALQFIARTSTGCARDAISLLDQLAAYGEEAITVERVRSVLGLSDVQLVHDLVVHLAAHDVGQGLDVINRVIDQGGDTRQFTQQVIDYLRAILLLRVGGDAVAPDLDAQTYVDIGALVGRFSTRDLLSAIKLFNQAQLDLRGSDQGQLALELAYVEAAMQEGQSATPPVPPPAPVQSAPRRSETPRRMSRPLPRGAGASPLPAAPPRSPRGERGASAHESAAQEEALPVDASVVAVTLEEVNLRWAEVRRAIRDQSRQAEALVNSSTLLGIESGNWLVLEFASEFLSGKLEKEETRQIVERALTSVLGKPCRVRGTVRGASALSMEEPAPDRAPSPPSVAKPGTQDGSDRPGGAAAEMSTEDSAQENASDPYQKATSDPIVRDLVSRGGRVTDVQVLPENG